MSQNNTRLKFARDRASVSSFISRQRKRKTANALEFAVTHQSQPITYNAQPVVHSGE